MRSSMRTSSQHSTLRRLRYENYEIGDNLSKQPTKCVYDKNENEQT